VSSFFWIGSVEWLVGVNERHVSWREIDFSDEGKNVEMLDQNRKKYFE
jgi:hypothetical protein